MTVDPNVIASERSERDDLRPSSNRLRFRLTAAKCQAGGLHLAGSITVLV